jgi:predicted transcriptional regulator
MAEVPPLMSDATVKMAQDFDVGLERMELRAKAFAAGLANAWFGQGGVIDTLKGTKYVAVEAGDSFGVLADGAEKGGKALAGLHEGMGVVLTGAQLLQNRLSALRSEAIVPLTQTQKDAVLELESYGEAQANIAKLLQVSEAAVHRFTEEQKAHTEAVKAAALDEAKAQQIAADAEEMLHRQFLKNWKEEETEKKRQTDTINKQVVTGFDEIQAAQAKLHDATMKDTLDSASYQINKIYETADAQVKAFKGTETQRKQYSDAVMNLADIEASHVMYAADTAMDDVAKKATDHIDDVSKKASNAMQSLQGGVKLPGSSETQAFGQTYLNSPTGARVPLGPHGELPKNWDALYSGQATIPQFAGGVQNFGGGLAVVGERGPELVTLPRGSDVLPYGRGVGGGVVQQIAIYVNGTAVDVAKQVADVLMRSAMQGQQFGGA